MALLLCLLHQVFDLAINTTSASIILGATGTVLAFVGNPLVMEAAVAWDGDPSQPHWRLGNRIQAIGFGMTIVALLRSYLIWSVR